MGALPARLAKAEPKGLACSAHARSRHANTGWRTSFNPSSQQVCQFAGPQLRAVKNSQDANVILSNSVGHDVRRAANDQFARPFDAPGTPACWKLQQHQHLRDDALVTAIAARGSSCSMKSKIRSRSSIANGDHSSLTPCLDPL